MSSSGLYYEGQFDSDDRKMASSYHIQQRSLPRQSKKSFTSSVRTHPINYEDQEYINLAEVESIFNVVLADVSILLQERHELRNMILRDHSDVELPLSDLNFDYGDHNNSNTSSISSFSNQVNFQSIRLQYGQMHFEDGRGAAPRGRNADDRFFYSTADTNFGNVSNGNYIKQRSNTAAVACADDESPNMMSNYEFSPELQNITLSRLLNSLGYKSLDLKTAHQSAIVIQRAFRNYMIKKYFEQHFIQRRNQPLDLPTKRKPFLAVDPRLNESTGSTIISPIVQKKDKGGNKVPPPTPPRKSSESKLSIYNTSNASAESSQRNVSAAKFLSNVGQSPNVAAYKLSNANQGNLNQIYESCQEKQTPYGANYTKQPEYNRSQGDLCSTNNPYLLNLNLSDQKVLVLQPKSSCSSDEATNYINIDDYITASNVSSSIGGMASRSTNRSSTYSEHTSSGSDGSEGVDQFNSVFIGANSAYHHNTGAVYTCKSTNINMGSGAHDCFTEAAMITSSKTHPGDERFSSVNSQSNAPNLQTRTLGVDTTATRLQHANSSATNTSQSSFNSAASSVFNSSCSDQPSPNYSPSSCHPPPVNERSDSYNKHRVPLYPTGVSHTNPNHTEPPPPSEQQQCVTPSKGLHTNNSLGSQLSVLSSDSSYGANIHNKHFFHSSQRGGGLYKSSSNLTNQTSGGLAGVRNYLNENLAPLYNCKSVGRKYSQKQEMTIRVGLYLFNKDPKKGLKFLTDKGFLEPNSPEDIAYMFACYKRGLNKTQVGEYLGSDKPFNCQVLKCFVELNRPRFEKRQIDEALRAFLPIFRLPGESQKIDRIMMHFGHVYALMNESIALILGGSAVNPTTGALLSHEERLAKGASAAHILAYAVMILNTHLHNSNVQSSMSLKDFKKNCRGCDELKHLEDAFLDGIYKRIKAEQFAVPEDNTTPVSLLAKNLKNFNTNLILNEPFRCLIAVCPFQYCPDARNLKDTQEVYLFLFNDLILAASKEAGKKKSSSKSGAAGNRDLFSVLTQTFTYKFHIQLLNMKLSLSRNYSMSQHKTGGQPVCVMEISSTEYHFSSTPSTLPNKSSSGGRGNGDRMAVASVHTFLCSNNDDFNRFTHDIGTQKRDMIVIDQLRVHDNLDLMQHQNRNGSAEDHQNQKTEAAGGTHHSHHHQHLRSKDYSLDRNGIGREGSLRDDRDRSLNPNANNSTEFKSSRNKSNSIDSLLDPPTTQPQNEIAIKTTGLKDNDAYNQTRFNSHYARDLFHPSNQSPHFSSSNGGLSFINGSLTGQRKVVLRNVHLSEDTLNNDSCHPSTSSDLNSLTDSPVLNESNVACDKASLSSSHSSSSFSTFSSKRVIRRQSLRKQTETFCGVSSRPLQMSNSTDNLLSSGVSRKGSVRNGKDENKGALWYVSPISFESNEPVIANGTENFNRYMLVDSNNLNALGRDLYWTSSGELAATFNHTSAGCDDQCNHTYKQNEQRLMSPCEEEEEEVNNNLPKSAVQFSYLHAVEPRKGEVADNERRPMPMMEDGSLTKESDKLTRETTKVVIASNSSAPMAKCESFFLEDSDQEQPSIYQNQSKIQ